MSSLEPSKLKVAELRAELQTRGLDSKGVKAVLVERLECALLAAEPEDVPAELAQEALPEAEQGFGEEFGFTANTDGNMQDDDILQGDDTGEEGGEGDDQFLADLDIPPAMEEPEAEGEAKAMEAAPQEQQTDQVAEEQQQPGESGAQPEGMDQEQAQPEKQGESKEPSADGDKKEENDKDKERKRDYENRNRDRKFGGRDRSPRRRTPPPVTMDEDDDIPDTQCVLSKYLSDLNLKIGKDGYNACPLSMEGFAYMWGGVKATHGVSKGKVAYECKLDNQADVRHMPPEETNRHVVRVGWSTDPTSLQLGEEAFSYGYGGTGKASVNCQFNNFGEKFTVGDVIGAYVDFEGEKTTISYTKNGKDLGVAFTINEGLNGEPLFPHVMVKNISVEANFGQKEEPWFTLKEGYSFIGQLPAEDTVRGPKPPATKKECELLMMVGLPGSGKTTWAIEACKEHTDKKYYILGTNLIMDKMKVMGLRRQRNYAGRWDKLMALATKCLNRFFEVAARKRRNYILDQTNVYPSARRRKMRPFEGFSTKAIVLVPTEEEFKKRVEKRTKQEGKDVPDHAVNEMKANFELPEKGVLFDDVDFVELKIDESKTLVDRYRKEGRDAGGLKPRFDRPGGGRDFRGGYDRGGYGRHDDRRGGGGGGYQSNYRSGGSDSGDRRGGSGGGGFRGGNREGGWNRGGSGGSYSGSSSSSGGYGGSRGGYGGSSGGYGGSQGGSGGYNSGGSRSASSYGGRGSNSGSSGGSNRSSSSNYGSSQSSGGGGYGNRQNQGSYNRSGNQQSSNYNQNRQSGYNQQSSYGSSGSNYGSNQGYSQNSTQAYGSSSGYGSGSNTSSSYNQSGSSSYGQQYQQPQQQQQQQQTPQQQYANYQQYQQYYQQNPQYAQQYAQYYSNYGNYGGSSGTTQ